MVMFPEKNGYQLMKYLYINFQFFNLNTLFLLLLFLFIIYMESKLQIVLLSPAFSHGQRR